MLNDRAADDRFWDWALARYQHAPLQAQLLDAQDRYGLVVLELMFAAWLAEQGRRYDTAIRANVATAILPWEYDVIRPLRAQRRRWRSSADHQDHYRRLQQLELDAERQMAAMLVNTAAETDPRALGPVDIARNFAVFGAEQPEVASLLADIGECFVQLGRKDATAGSSVE